MTGQVLLYATTSPIEIQLTPHEISLLKDYAYVSTNGTSIALDYHNGEIATLGDVSQLNEVVEGMNSKFITVFGTIGDTVNVEKVIPFPNGINPAKFIYLGYVAHNTNGYWYSNNSEIIIFTASNMGIRVKTSNTYFLNQTIKIFGVLVP